MIALSQRSRVSDDAVRRIVEMIRSGQYLPGAPLPGERILAEQLGVSRTSVRDAIHRLEAVGLLESRPGLGNFVKEPRHEALQLALAPHILTNQATLRKLFELRQIVEVEAAERAAMRITDAQLEAVRASAEAVEFHIARKDQEGYIAADVQFHRQIIQATDNDVLVSVMDSVAELLREMRFASTAIPDLSPEVIAGHRAIVGALMAHDGPAARQAMHNHLVQVASRVEAYWARTTAPHEA
jgi:GntR family transcriptional repressor for pyruvate dehydrogenase complex